MKHGMLTILKKELARFFGDKRTAFATIFLPALLIYLLYSVMGSALQSNFSPDDASAPVAAVFSMPESLRAPLEAAFDLASYDSEEAAKEAVSEQTLPLLIVFPEDFDSTVASYAMQGQAPNIQVYHNSVSSDSEVAYASLITLLDSYESSLANKFDINAPDSGMEYDLASEADESSSIFSMMLPMLMMMFLFSGCMAVAPEAIAGEKERGTIATLLITPVSRSQIALGKISALSIIALLSAASSTIGTILALPKLMGSAGSISASVYSVRDYLLLAAVILSTVLLLVTLISILSAFARTIKEAQTMVTPLMLVVMFLGITAMFGNGASVHAPVYLIPLYNSVQCMVSILTFSVNGAHVLLSVLSCLAYSGLGVWILTRMFRSERIIFSK